MTSSRTLITGIVEFSRSAATTFDYVRTLTLPAGYTLRSGQLSKDDLNYCFAASINSGMEMLYQVSSVNPSDSFNLGSMQLLQGINDTNYINIQPSISDS